MSAVETAQTLPEEPSDLESLAPATEHELREAGLRVASGKGRFGGMFSSDEDSSDEEGGLHRGDAGVGEGEGGKFGLGRRPSTTEAKERRPLDDGDDVEELGGGSGGGAGGGKGSSSEDEELLVEIKPRRKS